MAAGDYEGIVVLGLPRSGTTLLRRLLDAHSEIACPGETHLLTACSRFLESERVVDGMDVGVLNGLEFAGFDSEEVLKRLRELAFGFGRDYARRVGKRRWAEKTAVDAFHVEAIDRLCGEHLQFVCVARHGLDVACSMREWVEQSETHVRELHAYVARHAHPLEAYCHAWVDGMAALREFTRAHPENSVTVRYEDLLRDPEREMQRLIEFLGEPWEPGLVERAFEQGAPSGFGDWKTYSRSGIDASSMGRFQTLSQTTVSELGGIANATLAEWDYDVVETQPEHLPEEARRRYELGLLLQAMRRESSEGG